ncbi:MAG TPA: LysR substrate-binding domain-containing protein [Polyangiaceae bacterium]|nr:LysR substrate-binding domain-containing protein [Polyangiaceae bacterium]
MTTPLASTLPNILVFCATYELGSFSNAARRLALTPQAASRGVLRLEQTLGTTLFRRTTRTLTPTEAAHEYYRTSKEALELLARAESAVSAKESERAGLVRLSVPTTYGHHRLLPRMVALRQRYPGIQLEIHVANRNIDFASEGYDLAIRMGPIRTAGFVARKLGDFALGVFASPSYLARRGTPRTPAQLAEHSCIGFVMPSTGKLLPWTFASGPRSWVPNAELRVADDALGLITLARAGAGLIQVYDFLVEQELEFGTLVEVLREHRGASRPFSVVYPSQPKRSPAARTVIDFLLGGGPMASARRDGGTTK